MSRDPESPAEWQAAVDAAHAWRLLHDAKLYGLITGGPDIDWQRCDELLEAGDALGYHPAPNSPEELITELGANNCLSIPKIKPQPSAQSSLPRNSPRRQRSSSRSFNR